jgi:hypothetical protein
MVTESSPDQTQHQLIVAVYDNHQAAKRAVERLIDKDFPMDWISALGKAESSGDDVLGIYYKDSGERMKNWAAHGAAWGGLWGLLTAAAGMFVIPGLGTVMLLGPIVEMLAATVTGAALSGGAMAGAAAVSQLAVAMHRMGVPVDRLQAYHDAIEQGHYVVLIRCARQEEVDRWIPELGWPVPTEIDVFPYYP